MFAWSGVAPGLVTDVQPYTRWWTCSTGRCRTDWCWQAGMWWETSAVRTATASWAGSTSTLRRIASATRRAVWSWSGPWWGRARALRSTHPQGSLYSPAPPTTALSWASSSTSKESCASSHLVLVLEVPTQAVVWQTCTADKPHHRLAVGCADHWSVCVWRCGWRALS